MSQKMEYNKEFSSGNIQQTGTSLQPEHGKNKTKAAKKKMTSKRASLKENTCTFCLYVYCSTADEKWYIAKHSPCAKENYFVGRKCVTLEHCNHLPLCPSHMIVHKGGLSIEMKNEINDLIVSGASNGVIVKFAFTKYKVVLSHDQIRQFKVSRIDNIIKQFSNDGHGQPPVTAVDKLIALLRNMDNITYVFVKHNVESGFVTYMKGRKKPNKEPCEEKTSSTSSCLQSDVDLWRNALRISDTAEYTDEILVSLAWCHEEECRKLRMFPEFLGGDMTFGVNRQKRNLYVFTGIDGHKKLFTGFRCWMPSKQKAAYLWAINVAMPFLVGKHTAHRIRCVATDNEHAMVDAIDESMKSPTGNLKLAPHRLDYYHLCVQKWQAMGISSESHPKRNKIADVVFQWIKTWFYDIESEGEFSDSFKRLERYLDNNRAILTDHYFNAISENISRIVDNIEKAGEHHFKATVTLGYKGSSIVEGSNPGIKRGDHAAKASHSIETSTFNQLAQVDSTTQRRNIAMAKKLNSHNLWSRSLASDTLTEYMEGLVCKYFDSSYVF